MDDRRTFLLEMYRQMFADIDRHMTVVWQSVSVLIGAFALFALVEKNIVPLDVAISLIILLCAWLISHMLNAAYWYNRNLVIIANIERQFLDNSDKHDILFYFVKHRSDKNKMITHLRIQSSLGIAIAILVLIFHLSNSSFSRILLRSFAFRCHANIPISYICWINYLLSQAPNEGSGILSKLLEKFARRFR